MQGKSEGTVRMPSARASKRAPTWYSCTTTPKPLNGQPDPEAGHKRDFLGSRTAISSGVLFRRSYWGCSRSTFRFALNFFYLPNLPAGMMWLYLPTSGAKRGHSSQNFHEIQSSWILEFGHLHLHEITRALKWAPTWHMEASVPVTMTS